MLAHRGFVDRELAARGIVENTARSFEAAIEAGAEYLESDCHVTVDGEVVLFHDRDLRRVTGDSRFVDRVGQAELRRIMADRGGLLSLGEALERFPAARFNLDVKAAAAAEPVGRLVAPHADRVLITSFDERWRLRALRAAEGAGSTPATSPGRSTLARLLAATVAGSSGAQRRSLAGLDALQIPERYGMLRVLSPRLIEAAHRTGVEVHVWTVNDPGRMIELVALGVDGIITDRTDLALRALAEG